MAIRTGPLASQCREPRQARKGAAAAADASAGVRLVRVASIPCRDTTTPVSGNRRRFASVCRENRYDSIDRVYSRGGSIRGMSGVRYSIFSLARNALSHHKRWPKAWRSPEPKREYDVRHHRRRRPRACGGVLPRQAARHHQCRGGGEGLARRRQHRAQHHHRPIELPARTEREFLRTLPEAVGGADPRSELQRHVQPARGDQPHPQRLQYRRRPPPRQRHAAQWHRRGVAVGRRPPGDGAAPRVLAERALSHQRRARPAPRRDRAARRGGGGDLRGARVRTASTSSRTARSPASESTVAASPVSRRHAATSERRRSASRWRATARGWRRCPASGFPSSPTCCRRR